jgi:thiol:disulfide interchange protein/DsbC/DsbD-like thiol-disulfide interchange protein
MMIRALFFLLVAGGLALRGSDAIPAPQEGASASVTQPHVTAELIPETTRVTPGKPFLVALHLHMDAGWHTYWINFGDAGLPTKIEWTLPPGFTAGPIQWPVPEIHMMGGLTTYGYAGDAYLLTTITPPPSPAPGPVKIKAHATWLVCQEECIPGKADLSLDLDFNRGTGGTENPEREKFFAAAQARLPVPDTLWDVKSGYANKPGLGAAGEQALWIQFKNKPGIAPLSIGKAYFFPEQGNVLSPKEDDNGQPDPGKKLSEFVLALTLQQNGEKPAQISGVLVSDQPLIGDSRAVHIPAFTTDGKDIPMNSAALASLPAPAAPQAAAPSNVTGRQGAEITVEQPWLIAVLGAAFLGGLILNLMPCVLPVLSLKVFSLMRHAGENPRTAWRQGVAFTVGVVISFWVLAGLLLALRAAGSHLGWGFQMQSPGFVLALILLFFLLGLNLFGVFELGASLVGLDAKATGRAGNGLASSFLNGALATLAATPCTAPFMGSSLGFAAQQPPFIALLIFTFLALGMATPYLLLTIFPGALRFVPKPGAWMEAFKQFMGFLLMATVIFLVYVFGALVGGEQIPYLLVVLLIAGIAAWIYGRWGGPIHSGAVRFVAVVLALLALGAAIEWGVELAKSSPPSMTAGGGAQAGESWQPWTPAAVAQALAQDRPVFVDFTAAWCLSCKVNERVALETDAVRTAFTKKNVALFRADWTHADPTISETLQKYHRDGVPLYLLYSPKAKDAPQVLPEVLTPGIVLDALGKS